MPTEKHMFNEKDGMTAELSIIKGHNASVMDLENMDFILDDLPTKSERFDLSTMYKNESSTLLVLGGKTEDSSVNFCVKSWLINRMTNLPVDRYDFKAVMYKDRRILICGGRFKGKTVPTDNVEFINYEEKKVKSIGMKLKDANANFGAVYKDDKLFIAGGTNGTIVFNDFCYFDKQLKDWVDLDKLPICLKSLELVLGFDKRIYSIGGVTDKEFISKKTSL